MYKKYLTTRKILLIIFSILLLSIAWRFTTLLYFPASGQVLKKDALVKVHPDETIVQKFTAGKNDLAKVELLLRGPGIDYAKGDQVKTVLADQDCTTKLRTGQLEPSFLASNNLYQFSFPAVPDSAGKTYCLKATFSPQKASAKSLRVYVTNTPGAPYVLTNTTLNLKYPGSPLSMRPVYQGSFWQNLSQLNQRISQYKPFFLKHYYLWAILILFLVLSLVLAVVLVSL